LVGSVKLEHLIETLSDLYLYPSDGILYDDSPTSPWPLDSDNINAVWICYLDKYAMDALKDTVTWSILYCTRLLNLTVKKPAIA
jgi:hypothetical protein